MVGKFARAGREKWCLVTGLGGLRAVVERTDYGASVELSDGRGSAFWAYAVPGSVLDAAVIWARAEGAVAVEVLPWRSATACNITRSWPRISN